MRRQTTRRGRQRSRRGAGRHARPDDITSRGYIRQTSARSRARRSAGRRLLVGTDRRRSVANGDLAVLGPDGVWTARDAALGALVTRDVARAVGALEAAHAARSTPARVVGA